MTSEKNPQRFETFRVLILHLNEKTQKKSAVKELQRFSQWCRWIFVRLHNRRIFMSAMLPSVYYKTVV